MIAGHIEGTDYTVRMRYFKCHELRYYAGQQGQASRHPTRGGRLLKGWKTVLEVPRGRSTRGGRT